MTEESIKFVDSWKLIVDSVFLDPSLRSGWRPRHSKGVSPKNLLADYKLQAMYYGIITLSLYSVIRSL